MTTITGVLLAGGESRRFGSPKALAIHDGRPFYQHVADALMPISDKLVIVSHPSIKDKFKENHKIKIIEDLPKHKGKGPLAGLYSAMKVSDSDWCFLAACDMPEFSPEAAFEIANHKEAGVEAVIPNAFGRIQPLAGLYHSSVIGKLESLLEEGSYRMMALLDSINVKYVTENELGLKEDVFININRQEELKPLQKMKDSIE